MLPLEIEEVESLDGTFDPVNNTYTDYYDQTFSHVHSSSDCEGRGCLVHHPSNHHLRFMPVKMRIPGPWDIKPLHAERICDHGVGHPDPDDVEFYRQNFVDISVHGCCGCCLDDGL